jgi:hypothetical protein
MSAEASSHLARPPPAPGGVRVSGVAEASGLLGIIPAGLKLHYLHLPGALLGKAFAKLGDLVSIDSLGRVIDNLLLKLIRILENFESEIDNLLLKLARTLPGAREIDNFEFEQVMDELGGKRVGRVGGELTVVLPWSGMKRARSVTADRALKPRLRCEARQRRHSPRTRRSRGSLGRTRGSRRTGSSSRSAGGGSSGPDDGDPEPPGVTPQTWRPTARVAR